MLSEEVIDRVVERLTNRIEITNEYVLKEIGKSIKEVGTITPSKRNQLIQTLKYGGDFDKIVKKIAKITDMNVYDIYKIFDEIAKNDYRFAKQFYDYKKKKYIPYELNEALQNQVRTLASITAKEYLNLTNTNALGFGWVDDKTGEVTFKGFKKAYYDLLDEAVLSISEGKETFYDAMYRQLKKFGDSGLKVVYESGRAIRLDSAVRMCVKSGLTNMHMEMQKQIGEEFGSDGVEITVHNNPAPDHEEAQGKQFSNDEFKKLQETGQATTYDGIDIDMIRYHSFRPIGTMNCYHYTFAIVLGVNRPQYSNEALQKIRDKNNEGFELDGKHYTTYQGTQMQRQLETAIRTQKDNLALGKAGNNQKLIDKSEAKLRQLNKKYNELNQASGLKPKLNRLKNVDYDVKPGQNRSVSGIDNAKASVLSTPIPDTTPKTLAEWQKHFGEKYGSYDIIQGHIPYNEKAYGWLSVSDELADMDADILNDNLKQVEKLYDKYKLNNKGLSIRKEDRDDFLALTRGETDIAYSNRMFRPKKEIVDRIQEGMDGNFYMKVKKENRSVYSITHEFGHIIENRLIGESNIIERSKIDNQIKDELFNNIAKKQGLTIKEVEEKYISKYGRSRKSFEWFAESFAQLELGEKNEWIEEFEKWLKTKL